MVLKTSLKSSAIQLSMRAEKLVRGRPHRSSADLASMRSFLFLQYMMPLGYCVHDTPIYEALRTCMPQAQITVATRAAGYQTLRHNPYIDTLLSTADPLTDTIAAARELRAALQRKSITPECGITNCSNPRTRISLVNLLSGKHLRLGYSLAPGLYDRPQTYDRSRSLIDNNLRLLTSFGCPAEHVEPRVFFLQSDVENVRGLLQARGFREDRPLAVLVTQTSGGQRTGWHAERFTQLIRHVGHKAQVAFVGTAENDEAIKAIRMRVGALGAFASASLAGLTTIPELSALLCTADYVISLDTGTMHIGRAADVPMVVLGPSWQKPVEWLPLGRERVRILRGEDRDRAPEDYQLDEIEVSAVIAAFEELFTLYPASDLERSARLRKSTSTVDHASSG